MIANRGSTVKSGRNIVGLAAGCVTILIVLSAICGVVVFLLGL